MILYHDNILVNKVVYHYKPLINKIGCKAFSFSFNNDIV